MVLNDDMRFTHSFTYQDIVDGEVAHEETISEGGAFTRNGSSLAFIDDSGDEFTGSLSGSTLTTVRESGVVIEYQK